MTEVPYISQLGNFPRNDCGPACVLMLTRWVRPSEPTTVAQLAVRYDPEDNGTTSQNLADALAWLRLTPTRGNAAKYPFIQLVHYLRLPAGNRYDNKERLHWIVRLTDTTYHDPYNTGQRGAFLSASKQVLDNAEVGIYYRVGIAERPEMSRDEGRAREAYDRVFHVIPASATEAEAVEIFRAAWRAGKQTVGGSYDDAGLGTGLRSKKAILHGIPAGNRQAFRDFFSTWYPSTAVEFAGDTPTPPTPEPPPPVSGGYVGVGVNVLNGGPVADQVASLGYEAIGMTFNPGQAERIARAYPAMWVYVRPNLTDARAPNFAMWRERVELNRFAGLSNVIIGSINEGDQGLNDPTDKSILDRAQWDEACWNACKTIGVKYAGLSYSVGHPPVDQDSVAALIRKHYAPLVNAGMWANLHSYLGDDHGAPLHWRNYFDDVQASHNGVKYTFRRSWWTMERFRFYCLKCGFDPRKVNFCADEWLLEGCVTILPWTRSGGAKANNLSTEDFAALVRIGRAKMAEPVLFGDNGQFYPSPFRFVCAFVGNADARWDGYDVTPRIPLRFYQYR